jgi:hypothetical protein
MSFIEALAFSVAMVLGVVAAFTAPVLIVNLVDDIKDGIRRKKYPEYFKLYDNAMFETMKLSQQCSAKITRIKYQIDACQEELLRGRCSNENHKYTTSNLMEEYREVAQWFREQRALTESMWRDVDTYARENNLKWGEVIDR